MKKVLCLAFLALSLVGCAASVPVGEPAAVVTADPAQELLSELGKFTLNDLNVALELTGDLDHDGKIDPGIDNGDPIAASCYFFLANKVKDAATPDGNAITVAGVVSAFQSGRNIKRRVGGIDGFSDEFMLGCGPLITDVRGDVLKLVGRVAGKGLLPF